MWILYEQDSHRWAGCLLCCETDYSYIVLSLVIFARRLRFRDVTRKFDGCVCVFIEILIAFWIVLFVLWMRQFCVESVLWMKIKQMNFVRGWLLIFLSIFEFFYKYWSTFLIFIYWYLWNGILLFAFVYVMELLIFFFVFYW